MSLLIYSVRFFSCVYLEVYSILYCLFSIYLNPLKLDFTGTGVLDCLYD